jgi:tRNA pseudouridine(38-40) synthase
MKLAFMLMSHSLFAFQPYHSVSHLQLTCLASSSCSPTNLADAAADGDNNLFEGMASNALIRVSYDGTRFTGWSAANTQGNDKLQRPSKSRRRRGVMGEIPQQAGFVRSVEGVIRDNLAKIYGNVNPKRIIVEGCSRTDKGVHAQGMIAQIYCLTEDAFYALDSSDEEDEMQSVIPGKRIPHPISPTDTTYFEPMPMGGNLSRLAFALNRMRPADVQVTGIAPTPSLLDSSLPFHASLSSRCKTYEYRISIGAFQDPTMRRLAWFIPDNNFNIETIQNGCKILEGTHDFSAFQGTPRGAGDKRKRLEEKSRSTICTLSSVKIVEEEPPVDDVYFPGLQLETYKIVIVGDRFLYKMSRFIVGALVALGTGVLELDDVQRALDIGNWNIPGKEDQRKQFTCAPAHGLVLKSVEYNDIPIDWKPLRY